MTVLRPLPSAEVSSVKIADAAEEGMEVGPAAEKAALGSVPLEAASETAEDATAEDAGADTTDVAAFEV